MSYTEDAAALRPVHHLSVCSVNRGVPALMAWAPVGFIWMAYRPSELTEAVLTAHHMKQVFPSATRPSLLMANILSPHLILSAWCVGVSFGQTYKRYMNMPFSTHTLVFIKDECSGKCTSRILETRTSGAGRIHMQRAFLRPFVVMMTQMLWLVQTPFCEAFIGRLVPGRMRG